MRYVRSPAVAGYFYPAEVKELKSYLNNYLSDKVQANVTLPKAIIAPHAGYVYSGMVAGHAYNSLKNAHESLKRVVLLGPAHRYPLEGLAISGAKYFATPLGDIPVDYDNLKLLLNKPFVQKLDVAFEHEHCLEVHLPFLQTLLDDFKLLPILVGRTPPEQVADVIDTLWGDDETLVIVSSDLSHYHDYDTANKLDDNTCNAILNKKYNELGYDSACGRYAIRGLLFLAEQKSLAIKQVEYKNSGDTVGDKSRVVGYGAFHFFEED